MGRIKSHPKRKAKTITIIGTAAHAALAFSLPEEEVSTVAAIVTPIKEDTVGEPNRRRLEKLYTSADNDGDSDEDCFETVERDDDDVKRTKRVKFAPDVPREDKARRQLTFDDAEDNESDNGNRYESDCLIFQQVDGCTVINVPSAAYKMSTPVLALELMKFHLVESTLFLFDATGLISDISSDVVTLTKAKDVKCLLKHCNQSLVGDTDSIDVASIIDAFEAGILEIGLFSRTNETNMTNQVDISIRLLQNDSLGLKTTNFTPPIPVPRKLPMGKKNANSQKFSKPHPSHTLIQALGSIFKGSILDEAAKSCLTSQKTNTSKITAGMVYSLVDNAHANEYEQPFTSALDIPGLVPTLRPYQEAAIRWMLRRETENSVYLSNDEWELCWYVIVPNTLDDSNNNGKCSTKVSRCNIVSLAERRKCKSSTEERYFFCNPFAGWVTYTYEDARYLTIGDRKEVYHPMGGILAESMGLGKTVEIIACILANPSTRQPASIEGQGANHADEAISIYRSKTIIESRATLIVTPASILSQWEREISRHTTNLKVVIYPGIKDLCCNSLSHMDSHLVNPRMLADADVVLVTFEVLGSDIGHTNGNPVSFFILAIPCVHRL